MPTTISTAYFLKPGNRISALYCAEHVVVATHVPSSGFLLADALDPTKGQRSHEQPHHEPPHGRKGMPRPREYKVPLPRRAAIAGAQACGVREGGK